MSHCSIIIPAYNEAESIIPVLQRIQKFVLTDFECLVVVDSISDLTTPIIESYSQIDSRFRLVLNNLGNGPAYAIRAGINASRGETIVITMADGSDDPRDIDELCLLIERGIHVACASRYMPGGQQIGAPFLKSILSRLAGKSLHILTRIGTRDATNSFKAYSRDFLDKMTIESRAGFEIGLELVVKARRFGFFIAEIPTIWIERDNGFSKFRLFKWLPKYLRWYFSAFGPTKRGD